MSDHKWKKQRQGGSPDDHMSLEVVEFCELCGVENGGSGVIMPPCEPSSRVELAKLSASELIEIIADETIRADVECDGSDPAICRLIDANYALIHLLRKLEEKRG